MRCVNLIEILALILGLVIGSFLNVVIYRLPRGQSVVAPPSACPHCRQRLGPLELVPVVSWLVLRGRCRHCGGAISWRYPLIELLTGLLFWVVSVGQGIGPELLVRWGFVALLVALAWIDLDTYTLPWSLLYGLLGLGWGSAALGWGYQPLSSAIDSALLAAGGLVLIGEYASLAMRRLANSTPLGPIGYQTIQLAGLVGAWLGPAVGLLSGFLNASLNRRTGRVLRLPDALALGLAAVAPVVALFWSLPQDWLQSLEGMLISAGGLALTAGLYWWVYELRQKELPPDSSDPVALGFGDVLLAGAIASITGFWPFVAGLMVAVFLGLVVALLLRMRKVPFGPFLALGGLVALLWGAQLVQGYLGYLGLS
jgi:leader peptidase (prepilin peptidase)/N-methyltransferase